MSDALDIGARFENARMNRPLVRRRVRAAEVIAV